MSKQKYLDLHMHLNGSFSMDFLAGAADKNNQAMHYQKFLDLKADYSKLLCHSTANLDQSRAIQNIWQQFACVHHIIQTLDDVYHGTLNVIESSKADYLEIRTTPKALNSKSWRDYVVAFLGGLQAAKYCYPDKCAKGILSLDRTRHTVKDADEFIKCVVKSKEENGLLVGIDISGNPAVVRTLTKASLQFVIEQCLSENIGLAIHLGEIDNQVERDDCDAILQTLIDWKMNQKGKDPFHGKVRLGHGIYLTDDQRQLINAHQIPMEVCPSGHRKLNWWEHDAPHPIRQIYGSWLDPVVPGTDDALIFEGNAAGECCQLLSLFEHAGNDEFDIFSHHARFVFACG